MNAEDNIKKFNIQLPKAPDPVGSYVATKKVGNLLYISGQISIDDNGELIKGKLGKNLKTEDGTDDFIEQPKVLNGASDTIAKIFGEKGMHTRAAVSSNSLPLGVAVEVDAIFELV
jgi:enamine deaminase RidA (YjgF/YER057c/UK114 family)